MTLGVACTDDGGVDTVLTIAGGANANGSTTTIAGDFNIQNHNGTTQGLKLGGTLVKLTADQLNMMYYSLFTKMDVGDTTNRNDDYTINSTNPAITYQPNVWFDNDTVHWQHFDRQFIKFRGLASQHTDNKIYVDLGGMISTNRVDYSGLEDEIGTANSGNAGSDITEYTSSGSDYGNRGILAKVSSTSDITGLIGLQKLKGILNSSRGGLSGADGITFRALSSQLNNVYVAADSFKNSTIHITIDTNSDMSNINLSGTNTIIYNVVDTNTTLTVQLPTNATTVNSFQVPDGTTLSLSASDADGLTITGAGSVNITDLHSTLDADLSSISTNGATITLSSSTSLDSSAKLPNPANESAVVVTGNNTLTLGGTNNIQDNTNGLSISSGSTLSSTAAIITGETVSGAGHVIISDGTDKKDAVLGGITTTTSQYTGADNDTITGTLPAAGTCTINNTLTLGADSLLNTSATYTIVTSKSLTGTAARLSGHEINGAGQVIITAGGSTLNADLGEITTTTSSYTGTDGDTITGLLPAAGTCTINNTLTLGADSLLNTNAAYVIVNTKTLTGTAARLDGHEISGDGKTEITALHGDQAAVLSSITTDDVEIILSAATVLNLNARLPLPEDKSAVVISGSFRLTLHDDNIAAYGDSSHTRLSISSGTTLKASAALLTGKTVSGDGKAEITTLNETLGAVLSSITTDDVEIILSAATVLNSTARLPIPEDNTAVVISGSYKLTLNDNNIGSNTDGLSISSGTTLSGTAARLTGKTVSGAGLVEITDGTNKKDAVLGGITTTTSQYTGADNDTITGTLPAAKEHVQLTIL